jgi:hypothetical protein
MSAAPACQLIDPISIAFHFKCRTHGRRDAIEDVATRSLERVLRVVRPRLQHTGPLLVRMDVLLHSSDLGSEVDRAWRRSLTTSTRYDGIRVTFDGIAHLCDADDIFAVTLTGKLRGLLSELSYPLERYRRNGFLFSMEICRRDASQSCVYLGVNATPVGVLHPDGTLESTIESLLLFQPQLDQLLARLGIQSILSNAGLASLQRIVSQPVR